MKIVFFEATDNDRKTIPSLIDNADIVFTDQKLNDSTVSLAEGAEIVSVFVNSEVKASVIDRIPGLKAIITRSTGFDHVDAAYAKTREIAVSNVPSYGSRTVAEFAFALMLSLSRRVFQARLQLLETESFDISAFRGFDLQGKILGVIGTGRIGKNVIKIARGFDMDVIAYDVVHDDAYATENQFSYVELNDLLQRSDIVTLHAPYIPTESSWGPSTHHLLNGSNIPLMKQGALLINTARGELIETGALVAALAKGQLGGVALDVLEEERPLKEGLSLFMGTSNTSTDFKVLYENQLLMNHPSVLITPHIAFFTAEAEAEITKTTCANISATQSGVPINVVQV